MPLANQFVEAAGAARNSRALDEIARLLWRAHGEGQIGDAEASAVSEAIEGRRRVFAAGHGFGHPAAQTAARALPRGSKRREKLFGFGRPRALDRNAKARIMHVARCLSRRTEKGCAYGVITAKALAVLQALLWGFHNARSGVCFPSYEKIAEAAGCARSTVAEAIKALEDTGILTWVNRIKRVRERCVDLLGAGGWRWRVIRTSNAYAFNNPGAVADRPNSSKSEKPTGTQIKSLFFSIRGGGEVADAPIRDAPTRFRSACAMI